MKPTSGWSLPVLFTFTLMLSGCSLWPGGSSDDSEQEQINTLISEVRQVNEKLPSMEPMVLRATGYGAMNPNSNHLSPVQQRLITMRASKLDAYRTLAERVYGTQIIGSSTVENLVLQNDRFKTFVDAQILGARVVFQEPQIDGSYETIVEMVIDQGFRNCLASQSNGRRNAQCALEAVHDLDAMTLNRLTQQGLDPEVGTGLYFIE